MLVTFSRVASVFPPVAHGQKRLRYIRGLEGRTLLNTVFGASPTGVMGQRGTPVSTSRNPFPKSDADTLSETGSHYGRDGFAHAVPPPMMLRGSQKRYSLVLT